jgi:replicative DNA helicase
MNTIDDKYFLNAPPFSNPDSERAILGGLMRDPERIPDVLAVCPPSMMLRPEHRTTYSTLIGMHERGEFVDSTAFNMRVFGQEDRHGGVLYLAEHDAFCPSTANLVSRYAKEVAAAFRRREARDAAVRAIRGLADQTADVGEVFAGLVSAMEAAGATDAEDRWTDIGAAASGAIDNIATVREGKADRLGMPLPWLATEQIMPLMMRGGLGIVGGHTGHGKSSAARSIAKTVAEYGYSVLVYSLEMSPEQFAEGVVSSHANVSARDVRKVPRAGDAIDARHWEAMQDAAQDVARLPIWVCRDSQLTVQDVVARTHAAARRMARKGPECGLVVVDYLQLLELDGDDANRANAIGNAARSFKLMARALNVPVVVLSGTNNRVASREDKSPQMADLEGSGGIGRHADWVVFPVRPSMWDDSEPVTEAAMVWIKNRFGPLGTARLRWSGGTTTFSDRADDERVIR